MAIERGGSGSPSTRDSGSSKGSEESPAGSVIESPQSFLPTFFSWSLSPLWANQAGVSVTNGLRTIWARDRAQEMKGTRRQWIGVAKNRPNACVSIIPITIDNCVRTPS